MFDKDKKARIGRCLNVLKDAANEMFNHHSKKSKK
jgi:hypothetical protein